MLIAIIVLLLVFGVISVGAMTLALEEPDLFSTFVLALLAAFSLFSATYLSYRSGVWAEQERIGKIVREK